MKAPAVRGRPRIFAELFAGSAAVTLQLVGGSKLGPPVAYMGSKRYYARAVLAAFGLEPGTGAESLLLCDGGPWGWVWKALADPGSARAVAALLRSWRHGDPTVLWRRLATEPPPEEMVERVATWVALQEGNHAGKAVHLLDGRWKTHGYGHLSQSARDRGFKERLRVDLVANQLEEVAALPWSPCDVVHGDVDVALSLLPEDLYGAVIYLDPPYQGATRYAVDCSRSRVLHLAVELDRRGAFVGISEGEPMPLPGWHAIEITHTRKGIPRTASKQKREFLTLNRPPVWQVAEQVGLFGGES